MILTTTHNIEGHKIVDYLGIVTGVEVDKIISTKNMSFKDQFSQKKYDESMVNQIALIKENAFQKLNNNAIKLGANAVVGISVDIEIHGKIIVSVTGTAVKVV